MEKIITKYILLSLMVFFSILGLSVHATEKNPDLANIRVGVLAYQGINQAIQQWQTTIEYLNQKIPTHHFELVALDLQQMTDYVATNNVDFVITNTGNYVSLAHRYGISRLATMIKKRLNKTTMRFGAVIFTHKDRHDINRLEDLKGKSFIGVNKNGFGGFQMAWAEFKKHDIDPFTDFSNLKFSGFPQYKVVEAILNKEFDAGTFRTDSLESLAAAGKIDLTQIKILNEKSDPEFPFLHSTELFPEWPFSKLKHTPEALARNVALALLAMEETSEAAKSAQISGWTVPLNYKPANDLMKTLNVGPYKDMGKVTFAKVVKQYWPWILISLIFIVILTSLAFSIYCLNSKLRTANQQLGKEVKSRTKLTKKLQYKATHDHLTQAFNRRAFKGFVERELQRCERHSKKFAIMLIDVDNFKALNDNYGHQAGDEYLRQLSARFFSILQKTDIFARIGGDEFAVLCFDIDEADLKSIKQRILSVSNEPYCIDNIKINSYFSLGTAIYPDNGDSIKELYINADRDMYKNKKKSALKSQ